jgi:hypothetical protein
MAEAVTWGVALLGNNWIYRTWSNFVSWLFKNKEAPISTTPVNQANPTYNGSHGQFFNMASNHGQINIGPNDTGADVDLAMSVLMDRNRDLFAEIRQDLNANPHVRRMGVGEDGFALCSPMLFYDIDKHPAARNVFSELTRLGLVDTKVEYMHLGVYVASEKLVDAVMGMI